MNFFKKSAMMPAMAIFFSCLLILPRSAQAQNSTLIFSVTGDIPYSSSEDAEMQEQIADHNLYSPSEFLVHIGDIKAGSGSCSQSIYTKVAGYLLVSELPVFITPGDNEWIDCSNPSQAWSYWAGTFLNFEQNFCGAPAAQHQSVRPENFAWTQNGVLLIGINMPGGSEGSGKTQRLEDNADWVTQQFNAYGSQVRAAVIFAHDLNESRDAIFFDQFGPVADSFGKPILYIHGSGHSWIQDFPLPQENVMRVQVDNGGAALPVQVTVTTSNPAAFVFDRNPWDSNSDPIDRPPCGQTAPNITVNPSSHNYGDVAVGSSSSQTFVVFNDGNVDLVVTSTTLTSGDANQFSISSGGGSFTLSPGQTRNVIVDFNPNSTGSKNTTLRFVSNDPDDGTKDISLTGAGVSTTTQFTLTVNSAGAGSVDLNPIGGTYDEGTVVTLTALPAAGWIFSNWSGDLTGSNNPATITMDANKNVTAVFTTAGSGGPIAYEETQTGGSVSSNTVTTTANLTAASGHLYLAAISFKPKVVVSLVSGLGLNWTPVKAQCAGRNQTGVELWMAIGAPSGNGNVTANFATTPSSAVIAVSRYSGAAAVSPLGNMISGNTNGANGACSGGSDNNAYSFNLATTMNGSLIYCAAAMRSRTHTPGAGYTERVEFLNNVSSPSSIAVQDQDVASASTVVVNGSFNGSVDWAMAAVEIKPSTGSGTQYTLTTNVVGSGSVALNPAGGTYDAGTIVTLTATAAAGFQFSGWSGDLSGAASPTTITMDANKNVTATFTAVPTYTLTVNTSGSGSVALNPPGGIYDAGTVVTLTATAAAGFQFTGWSGDLSGATNPTTITMDANKNVTATLTAIPTFTLTVNTTGSGSVALNPAGGTYDAGTIVTLTATAAAGFQFSGWSGDLTGAANPTTIAMEANKNVTATFTAVPTYTLTVNTTGSGSVALNPPGGTYDAGTVVTLTATAAAGFQFTGWSGDLSGAANPTTITMDANKNVTATFTAVPTYTLTTNVVGSGSVALNPPGGTYNAGTVVTLTATPDVGFQFSSWSGDLTGATNPTTITMDANKNVTATFTAIPTYTLTVNTVGSGSVVLNPAGGTYDAGTVVTLTATADAGFQFSNWSGDLNGATNPATITMDANKNVTATFTVMSGQVVHEETKTGGSTALNTVTTSTNLTAVNGHLYLAAISFKPKLVVNSVSGLGLTWTLVKAQCAGRSQTGIEIWMAQGTPSGDGTVTATFASVAKTAVIAVSRYSGANAVNPLGNLISGNTTGANGACSGGSDNASYSFNLTTTVNGAVIYSVAGMRNRLHTPGAGYTERAEFMQGSGGDASSVAVQDQAVASLATVVANGSFSGSVDWAVVAIEIKP